MFRGSLLLYQVLLEMRLLSLLARPLDVFIVQTLKQRWLLAVLLLAVLSSSSLKKTTHSQKDAELTTATQFRVSPMCYPDMQKTAWKQSSIDYGLSTTEWLAWLQTCLTKQPFRACLKSRPLRAFPCSCPRFLITCGGVKPSTCHTST